MQIIYSNGYIHHATSDCGRYAVAFGSLLIDGAELQWGKLWTAEGMTSAAQTDIDAVLALDANVRAANDATDAKVRAAIDERERAAYVDLSGTSFAREDADEIRING